MFIDKWNRKKVGEEKKVKEKQGGGERQEHKEHKDWGGELSLSNRQLYSGTVQKVLLHNCIHFM